MSDPSLAADEPYPFESDDDIEIGELDLEDVDAFDAFADERITVGELVSETESWRFGHVIVDEAQDLTPMQWRMVMRRVAGRSLTIVGDLAQRSAPGVAKQGSTAASRLRWRDQLPAELADVEQLDLTVNYRSPAEIHELALRVLASYAPDLSPATPLRTSGVGPRFVSAADAVDLDHHVGAAVAELRESVTGQIAVIGVGVRADHDAEDRRVRHLSARDAKGLEFDAVVLVEPAALLREPAGAALLYIALTRATQRLVVVHAEPLPAVMQPESGSPPAGAGSQSSDLT